MYANRRQGNTTVAKAICIDRTGNWHTSAKRASVPVIIDNKSTELELLRNYIILINLKQVIREK